jgi:hypothetical protein
MPQSSARVTQPAPADQQALAAQLAENLATAERSVAALGAAVAALAVLPGPATTRAALSVEQAWRDMEAEFGLLSAAEISARAGSRATSVRAWASQKRRDGQLLGVTRRNRVLYPGFQIDSVGAVVASVPAVWAVFRAAGWREDHVLLWFTAANGRLAGQRPADLMPGADPAVVDERLVAAARAATEQW